jgi:phosphate-selective porin OprO and OprP
MPAAGQQAEPFTSTTLSSDSRLCFSRFSQVNGDDQFSKGGNYMTQPKLSASVALGLAGALIASQAHAESAGGNDAEIALLKQQLRLMEQKLDRLQRQTEANAASAAKANAKADAKADPKVTVASANAAYAVKGPVAPSDVVVTMPNNGPTICTADNLNCVAITGRIHFDAGGYDYHPNSALTTGSTFAARESA